MTQQELQVKAVKVILLSQLLIEANDDIKESSLYKGKLKVFGKQYINQLGTAIKQTANMHEAQATMYMNFMRNLEQLVEKLAKCSTDELVMINQIHDHYKGHKEDWNAMYDVELVELDG